MNFESRNFMMSVRKEGSDLFRKSGGRGGGCSFCVKDKLNSEIFNDLGGVDTLMHTMTNRHSHRQHF